LPLSTEDKRNVLRRVSGEIFGQGKVEVVEELLAPDFVDHDPLPGISPKRDGIKDLVHLFQTSFPGIEVQPLHLVVEGDKGVDHTRFSGTHAGEFMGIPATGKRIDTSVIVISMLGPDGRITERWQRFGAMQLLQQLGVIPGWEEPPPLPPIPVADRARTTTPDENRALMTSQLAIWNDGDYDLADELFHPESITPDAPQLPRGPEGCKQVARVFRDAFPDFQMTVEDTVAEGEFVVCRFRQTGTHDGELFGIAPTGRRVEFEEMALCQFAGGQIVATWFQTDMLGLMGQLGVGGDQAAARVAS
jgi:predicted ester cyclase